MASPTKNITLNNGSFEIPVWIEEGVEGVQLISSRMSSVFAAGGGAQRYGEGEPEHANLEQRDWSGGRANEFFASDPSRFNDEQNVWSLTPEKLFPSPLWKFGKGHRPNLSDEAMPGSVSWRALFGASLCIDRLYVPAANITADKAYVLIRRRGTPGDLTLKLCSDSSGEPGTVLKTATVTTTTVTDVISVLQAFDWSGTEALTGSTTYHLKVCGAATDNSDNHWEVGVDVSTGGTTLMSSDDSTWNDASYSLYYRVVGADIKVSWKFFVLKQSLYALSLYHDGTTASRLWLNGARGVATAGGSTTLTNSNAAFGTSSEYVGALVKIIAGTGVGQIRTIASHTGTALTVSEAWLTNPSTDSEYIIYQTKRWTEITSTGIGVAETVAVYNNIAHIGHKGNSDPIRRIRFNAGGSPPAHEFEDDGSNANVLATSYVAGTGVVIWRAVNTAGSAAISVAPTVAWGADHTFGTAFAAGDGSYPVKSMVEYTSGANSRLYVLKTNEIGFVDNGKYYRLNIALNAFPENTNGAVSLVNGLYLWFPFLWSLQRVYGEAVDDIDPNSQAGLPEGRQGNIAGMANHPVGPIVGIDAGTGTSAAMFFNGIGYHEIFRAWEANKRISDLVWQPNEGGKRWLWMAAGDDLIYMEMPRWHRNPVADSTQEYMWESVITTSIYDMNNSAISKYWQDITINTKNLNGQGIYADVYKQSNTNIDSDDWEYAGRIGKSPTGRVDIREGDSHQVRFRIHLFTDSVTTPPIVNAINVKGIGMLPFRWKLTFRGHFGPVARALGASDTRKSLSLLAEGMERAQEWTIVDSEIPELEGARVLAEIARVRPSFALGTATDVYADIILTSLETDLWRTV